MDDFLRQQIQSARDDRHQSAISARIARGCWPGGVADRSVPVALQWLRRWWPERLGEVIPACSCRNGHCPLCN